MKTANKNGPREGLHEQIMSKIIFERLKFPFILAISLSFASGIMVGCELCGIIFDGDTTLILSQFQIDLDHCAGVLNSIVKDLPINKVGIFGLNAFLSVYMLQTGNKLRKDVRENEIISVGGAKKLKTV